MYENVKGRIIDEEDFLMFVEKNFRTIIFISILSTYSDLTKKIEKGTTQIIPDIIESIPEVIHNKKSITKSINAKISSSDVKTKRCVFPFKYKDMIYKNCINYRELGPQPVCAIDTKGKNKYGVCPGEPMPASQLKSYTKTKLESNNRNNSNNSDKYYSIKPVISKKIKLNQKKRQ